MGRTSSTPIDYFDPEDIERISKNLIASGHYLSTKAKNGRHGDIRPRNVLWNGVSVFPRLVV
jgi:hypothetical protein